MPLKKHCNDTSEYALIDEKKRKRMISNRESARRSRMKHQLHVKNLQHEIAYFISERTEMVQKIDEIMQYLTIVESENIILREQKEELRRRLEYAKMVANYMNMENKHPVSSLQKFTWRPPLHFRPLITSEWDFPALRFQ